MDGRAKKIKTGRATVAPAVIEKVTSSTGTVEIPVDLKSSKKVKASKLSTRKSTGRASVAPGAKRKVPLSTVKRFCGLIVIRKSSTIKIVCQKEIWES